MSANDNAYDAIFTVSLSANGETASREIHVGGITPEKSNADVVEKILDSVLMTMDILLSHNVSFDEIKSLVRASKATPPVGVPLYALSINREELLLEMFKNSPLMPQADSPAHGLELLRKAHPAVIDIADRAAVVAIQRIGELLSAKLTGDGSSKVH